MISEISKDCSAVMFRVSQSKKISCLQEHYMGMNNEGDGEPLGALLLGLGCTTKIFCSSDWITGMEVKLYSSVFYK